MSKPIDSQIGDRICQHMNKDHQEALIFYAQVYGNISQAEKATMISLDSEGMNLSVQIGEENQNIRIKFDHLLENAQDAHHTLVEMLKKN